MIMQRTNRGADIQTTANPFGIDEVLVTRTWIGIAIEFPPRWENESLFGLRQPIHETDAFTARDS